MATYSEIMEPLVSVIVPTKNSARTLERCLRSVRDQSYKNIELIVVDNNSTDETKVIAERFANKVFNEGPERSAQRNFGAEKSDGTYVLMIDSDMVISNVVVEECVNKTKEDHACAGIIIPEESFGEGFWAKCKQLERSFYVGVEWMEAARFFEKKSFLNVGGYDVGMVSGEDWDLSQRVGKEGRIARIENFIYHNEGNMRLFNTVMKKYYYAGKFAHYVSKNKDAKNLSRQTGIIGRYTLFIFQPKKLFQNPVVGVGMLFMKTCEFFFGGIGYVINR